MVGDVIEVKLLRGGSGKMVLNTTSYPNGVYLATIKTAEKILLKDKFVILK